MRLKSLLPPSLSLLLLCACGGDGERAARDGGTDPASENLPRPAGTTGSVTGMPDEPGPGQPIADASTDPATDVEGLPLPPEVLGPDGLPLPPALPGDAPAGDAAAAAIEELGAGDAVALVRAYYEAINAADFDRAHALWSDGGNASGQTAEQFARGFADTAGVVAQVEPPGRIEGAAGSRFIEVPVAIEARQRDGGVRRFVGAYTLRRSVVDGATEAQRQWRIASADIREVRP